MTGTLFDLDSVPLLCPACLTPIDEVLYIVGQGVKCSECYVNEHCPAGCNVPHPTPVPRGWRRRVRADNTPGTWECPTTQECFRYLGPNNERDFRNVEHWHGDTWGEGSFLHDDYWYEDQCDAGFQYCEACDECVDGDSARWRNGSGGYCRDCSAEYDEDYGGSGDCGCETVPTCSACHQTHIRLTHYHLITENVFCLECGTDRESNEVVLIPELVAA
jgi:hypothetical protein